MEELDFSYFYFYAIKEQVWGPCRALEAGTPMFSHTPPKSKRAAIVQHVPLRHRGSPPSLMPTPRALRDKCVCSLQASTICSFQNKLESVCTGKFLDPDRSHKGHTSKPPSDEEVRDAAGTEGRALEHSYPKAERSHSVPPWKSHLSGIRKKEHWRKGNFLSLFHSLVPPSLKAGPAYWFNLGMR